MQTTITTATQRVAATVRAELARRRIQQTEVAARLGIVQASVSRRLTGDTPWDINELAEVADLIGVRVADLVADADVPAAHGGAA